MAVLDLRGGIWPAMVTPYLPGGQIDEDACDRMVEWYARQGVQGIFACCQSSEMFFLSQEERVRLARCVARRAKPLGLQVIASGHVADDLNRQIEDMRRMADAGADALILVTNRLAAREEGDDVFRRNMERLLEALPGVELGLYECPYPYKRLLSPEMLKWCVDTGRFSCMKETSCDADAIGAKLKAIRGAPFRLLNANTATLLASLRLGAAGLSGIMPNFHARLYVRLMDLHSAGSPQADALQRLLTVMGMAGYQSYPLNAKYTMRLHGIDMALTTRFPGARPLAREMMTELDQMHALAESVDISRL